MVQPPPTRAIQAGSGPTRRAGRCPRDRGWTRPARATVSSSGASESIPWSAGLCGELATSAPVAKTPRRAAAKSGLRAARAGDATAAFPPPAPGCMRSSLKSKVELRTGASCVGEIQLDASSRVREWIGESCGELTSRPLFSNARACRLGRRRKDDPSALRLAAEGFSPKAVVPSGRLSATESVACRFAAHNGPNGSSVAPLGLVGSMQR